MKIKRIYLPLLVLVLLSHIFSSQPYAFAADWTEKKLGKVSMLAAKAASKKRWSRAIKYGEQTLEGSAALDKPDDARYLGFLKNLNRYYDKSGRLQEVAPRVKNAYSLSMKHLGVAHPTTKVSRILLYKLHISYQNYKDAIPLVLENIAVLEKGKAGDYNHHQYLKQLYSLYSMAGQLELEEKTLIEFLELDKRLYGSSDKDNIKIIQNLAFNYCRQKKLKEFYQLIKRHQLLFTCK